MRKMIICLLAAAVVLGGSASLSCAEKETPSVKMIDGELSLVDSGQSVLTVKWFKNPQDAEKTEKTFLIPKGAVITKGGAVIKLSDLKEDDPVVIKYVETKEGVTVNSIAVKELPLPMEAEPESEAGDEL